METVPDFAMVRYNPLQYPGDLLLNKESESGQSYVMSIYAGAFEHLQNVKTDTFSHVYNSFDTGL